MRASRLLFCRKDFWNQGKAFAKKLHAASFLARERRAEIVDAALNNELLLVEEKAEKKQNLLATDAQHNRALECDDLAILNAPDTVLGTLRTLTTRQFFFYLKK